MKTVGVLGGYGPAATAHFFAQLVQATPARRDWEHLHVVINDNPHVPSRARAFLYGEEDPTVRMLEEIERLRISGADFFVCPCNSAHYFLRKASSLPLPFLDMVETTVKRLLANGSRNALLLGSEVTMQSGMYTDLASQAGIFVQPHPNAEEVREIIEAGKTGIGVPKAQADLARILDGADEKYDSVILGCTELPLVFDYSSSKFQIFDTAQILVEETVRYANA